MLRLALLLLSIALLPGSALAQGQQSFIDYPVRICDAEQSTNIPPDFTQAKCRDALFYQADPQDQMLWVEFVFEAQPALLDDDKPLGLFLSAKASSEAYFNNVPIGSNGTPGTSQLSEEPGDMDAVFFVPEGTLKAGKNRLVMRMSSMNGEITLNSPIHNIVLAPYRDPRQPGAATWFALITFGLFVAATVFFGVRSLRGNDGQDNDRRESALIACLCVAAALQLAAEATRDILPYPYPMHDLRLSLILAFAMGVGLSLAAYVFLLLFRPYPKQRMMALGALLLIMLVISAAVSGFDLKTVYVLVAASLAVGLAGTVAYFQGNQRGRQFALAGTILTGMIVWLGGFFLDTVLYLIIATGLLWLLYKQARGGELLQRPSAEPEASKRIELTSNGKVEFVDVSEIVRFSGAGDYVEVFLNSGRSALYSASLAGVERERSDGFIRVHRSHIVNAAYVKSLSRKGEGTGELQMSDGSCVPVSRRNMASVKAALALS